MPDVPSIGALGLRLQEDAARHEERMCGADMVSSLRISWGAALDEPRRSRLIEQLRARVNRSLSRMRPGEELHLDRLAVTAEVEPSWSDEQIVAHLAEQTRRAAEQRLAGISRARSLVLSAAHIAELPLRERAEPARGLARSLTQRPQALREVLELATPQEARTLAGVALVPFVDMGAEDRSLLTLGNLIRVVQMMEVIDPQASPVDMARLVRRHFYGDALFQVAGLSVASGEPSVSDELKRLDERLTGLRRWQVVDGVRDRRRPQAKTDVAHALVALDAYASRTAQGGSGMRGQLDALLFTEIGDLATHLMTAVGLRDAGNYNDEDANGNGLGLQLVEAYASGRYATLSGLLAAFVQDPAGI